MIALYNFAPKHCPNCGAKFGIIGDRLNSADYFAGASQECGCGLYFAFVSGKHLLKAADKENSDLSRYADASDD